MSPIKKFRLHKKRRPLISKTSWRLSKWLQSSQWTSRIKTWSNSSKHPHFLPELKNCATLTISDSPSSQVFRNSKWVKSPNRTITFCGHSHKWIMTMKTRATKIYLFFSSSKSFTRRKCRQNCCHTSNSWSVWCSNWLLGKSPNWPLEMNKKQASPPMGDSTQTSCGWSWSASSTCSNLT